MGGMQEWEDKRKNEPIQKQEEAAPNKVMRIVCHNSQGLPCGKNNIHKLKWND